MRSIVLAWASLLVWLYHTQPAPSPEYWTLEAVTPSGDVYEAGAGTSCNSAWRDPVFPVAVDHVTCRRVR